MLKKTVMENIIQVHCYFSGIVQGVGFRFTSRYLARKHNLKGWVRNLYDGRVELVAQGEKQNIMNFLEDLKSEFSGYIKNIDLEWQTPQEEFEDFEIRF